MRHFIDRILNENRGFNPRICKRCDNGKRIPFYSKCRFNPRICKRCDYAYDVPDSDKNVSIHASVKDAT